MIPITKKGYDELLEKLADCKQEMNQIPGIIAKARAKGDLKENAEYHAAREKQGFLNAQIGKLNGDLQNSRIIDPKTLPAGIVNFGKVVTLINLDNQEEEVYVIMGPNECDRVEHAISITSVLAKSLIGKKENDEVELSLPNQTKRYLVKKIDFN